MMSGVHVEVMLAATYAIALVGIAFVLELLARHSHQRSARYRSSGFIYLEHVDAWECPAGQQLIRRATDHQRRLVHYRAPAHTCNACALKTNCTESDEGRVLASRTDSWLESELRRFHRGISLALLLLATVILLAEGVRHTQPRELLVVGSLLIPLGAAGTKLFAAFMTRQESEP
jgi:hypothetical protein